MKSLFTLNHVSRHWSRTLVKLVRVLAIGAAAVVAMQAGEWRIGAASGVVGGRFPSLRIDKFGNAHVSSFSATNNALSYAFWDRAANRWFTTALDQSSGFCSLALDSQQRPHISYIEYGTGKLKYAHWNGGKWEKQALPIQAQIISYNTSIALDAEDRPLISFYEEFGMGVDKIRLRIMLWNGKFWELRTVDAAEGSGKFNSLGIDSTGHPQIAYGNVEYKNASLRFARWNGKSWDLEILEGEGRPGTSMWSVGLALDQGNAPHIAYTDVANRLVKYAVKRAGKWQIEVLDEISKVGYPDRNGIALDEQGNVYISYYDAGMGMLKLAYKKNGKWVSEIVDEHFSGFTSCLRIVGKSIWLVYSDETGEELRYARGTVPDNTSPAKAVNANEFSK